MSNKLIKILIVDDEIPARNLISDMLEGIADVVVIGEANNGKDAVRLIKTLHPDLVFLDIQMPLLNGFQVLENLQNDVLPEIIFVTAFDNFAIKAFEMHALDYLLKPISQERLNKALEYAKARITDKNPILNQEKVASLVKNYEKPQPIQRVFVKDNGKIVLLEPQTIDWIEADDKYLHLHTKQKTYLLRQTMNSIEAELDSNIFLRIHRSTIVNLTRVREIHPIFNNEYVLILEDKTKLTLSRNYKNRFFERFGKTA